MQSKSSAQNQSNQKLFRFILILIPFAFLLFLQFINYGPDFNLFILLEDYPQYLKILPSLGTRYFPYR